MNLINDSQPEVVITAYGVVSPLGSGAEEFNRHLDEGTSGIEAINIFDIEGFPINIAGLARESGAVISCSSAIDRKALFMDKVMKQITNGINIRRYSPDQLYLAMGTGADYVDIQHFVEALDTEDENINLQNWQQCRASASSQVAEQASQLMINRFTTNISACVASTQAIGLAYRYVKKHPDGAAIGGGFDSMVNPLSYMGFYMLGALAQWTGSPQTASRPFDRKRCGLVIGEGAAGFFLENRANADEHRIVAKISGYASTMDAYMVTDPAPDGNALARAILVAMGEAGLGEDDIDCIDAHGTGTIKNAYAEINALKIAFPNRWQDIPVFALKGQIGHLIGACGAVECCGMINILQTQRVPITQNCENPDDDIPLRIIRDKPLSIPIRHILKINAAFGGQNTALILSAKDEY